MKSGSKIKIAFVIDSFSFGGTEKITIDLINSLNPELFDIGVYSLFNSSKLQSNLIKRLSRSVYFKELNIENYSFNKRLSVIRKELSNYQVIHTCLDMSNFYIPLAYYFNKNKILISSIHGRPAVFIKDASLQRKLSEKGNLKYVFITKYLQHIMNRRIDTFLALSNETKKYLLEDYNINPYKVEQFYYGYNYDDMIYIADDETVKLNTDLKINNTDFVCSYFGRLTYAKGIIELILVIKRLIEKNHSIKLLLVGDGDLSDEINLVVKRLNLSEDIIFTGYVENIEKYFALTDLMVLPSYSECFPLVIQEAMYLNVPVIASDVGGIPEIIEDNVTGYLFKRGDFKELEKKMENIISRKTDIASITANAHKNVMINYNLKVNKCKFENIVRKKVSGTVS